MNRLQLGIPWLLLVVVVVTIVGDQLTTRPNYVLNDGNEIVAGEGHDERTPEIAKDHVCGMDVRPRVSRQVQYDGANYFFCSEFCVEEFTRNPKQYTHAPAADSHIMRGVPTWLVQLGVAVILVLSFGLFELIPRRRPSESEPDGPRWTITPGPVKRFMRSHTTQLVFRLFTVFLFLLVIVAGLLGNQDPSRNIATILTWTVWWVGLVFIVLYAGKAWCYVCPWDAIATWFERGKLKGPRTSGIGLGKPWPRRWRNIWPAVGCFVALTWIDIGYGITRIPWATSAVAIGMLGLAIASALIFDRKSFCRYACLVGRVSGLYAQFSPVELRSVDAEKCAGCKTHDCFRGNSSGDPCPTFEFPKTMTDSTYCIACGDCMNTCPHNNIDVRLRPWGADLVRGSAARPDEAILCLILLALTAFHGLTMTPLWPTLLYHGTNTAGLSISVTFTLLMLATVAIPIVFLGGCLAASSRLSGLSSVRELFLMFAGTLLPIALFYHLAHNAEHLLIEGPKMLVLASDPFGYGIDIFGTGSWTSAPWITLEGLWILQIIFILIGHVYSLWLTDRTARVMVDDRRRRILLQAPLLVATVLFSLVSLWLLAQPMTMRSSGI